LYEQHERTGQKAYPVLTSGPDKVLETALRLADTLTRRSGILRLSSSGVRRATACSSLSPVWLLLPISRSSKRVTRSLC
jgi:hypothetical protein